MRRNLALIVVALATLALSACSDITAPPEPSDACPIYNGSGRCEG